MELITEYIKPELIVVAVVLYIVGIGLKKTTVVKDKWIPVILGSAGILLCGIWVFANGQWAQDGKRHLRYSRPLFREFLLQEQVLTSIRF